MFSHVFFCFAQHASAGIEPGETLQLSWLWIVFGQNRNTWKMQTRKVLERRSIVLIKFESPLAFFISFLWWLENGERSIPSTFEDFVLPFLHRNLWSQLQLSALASKMGISSTEAVLTNSFTWHYGGAGWNLVRKGTSGELYEFGLTRKWGEIDILGSASFRIYLFLQSLDSMGSEGIAPAL
jgi:hypothetical protein